MNEITLFSKKGLDKIKSTSILEKEDFIALHNMSSELQHTFEKKQIFRTETEIRYSVLDDVRFPTLQSKYWQSIKEQDVFFTNLVYLSCDYEQKQGELELLEIELSEIIPSNKSNALKKIKQSQIKKAQFQLMEMRLIAKDRLREIKIWEKVKKELKSLGEFDKDDCDAGQKETLTKKWTRQLQVAKATGDISLGKSAVIGLDSIMEKDGIHKIE